MDIDNIIKAIQKSFVKITDHADEEVFNDNLTYDKIYSSVIHGEIIEGYTNDRPYPSCLVMGINLSSEPIIAFGPIIQTINGQC